MLVLSFIFRIFRCLFNVREVTDLIINQFCILQIAWI